MPSNKQSKFGFKTIDQNIKQKLVNQVFDSVASKYDLMNNIMSLGIHHYWKRELINYLFDLNASLLDLAGGTGDIALLFYNKAKKYGADPRITICDINYNMLLCGKNNAINLNIFKNINYVNCNAESLPFYDNSFDYVSISFGLRNVANINLALKEIYRILKPGGRFVCLEFSKVENCLVNQLYDLYSLNVIPFAGKVIVNDKSSYQYLVESIRTFPDQKHLCKMLEQSNFRQVSFKNLTFGIVAIHTALKASSNDAK